MLDITLITGAARCGLSMIGSMLNCSASANLHGFDSVDSITSPGVYIGNLWDIENQLGIKLLDVLISLKNQYNLKLVWITRDPVTSLCSYKNNLGLSIERGWKHWFIVNSCLMYLDRSICNSRIVKFEDVLMSEIIIQSMFSFLGIEFNKQYINYGDFDQKYHNKYCKPEIEMIDSYPKTVIKEHWSNYSTEPIVSFLRYCKNQLD